MLGRLLDGQSNHGIPHRGPVGLERFQCTARKAADLLLVILNNLRQARIDAAAGFLEFSIFIYIFIYIYIVFGFWKPMVFGFKTCFRVVFIFTVCTIPATLTISSSV